jgi:mannose-6-phosphate isomerase-like protein (cupin superfamily)
MPSQPEIGADAAVELLQELTGSSAGLSYGVIAFAIRPHSRSQQHHHESEESWIVRSGSGYAILGGQRVTLDAGKRVIVPSRVPHFLGNDQAEPLVVLGFWWRQRNAAD